MLKSNRNNVSPVANFLGRINFLMPLNTAQSFSPRDLDVFIKSNFNPLKFGEISPLKKYPYLEFFWSVFSRIWTEFGKNSVNLCTHSKCGEIGIRKILQFWAVFLLRLQIHDSWYLSWQHQDNGKWTLKTFASAFQGYNIFANHFGGFELA